MKKILPSTILCSVICILFTAVHAGEILGTLKQVSVGQTGVEVLIEVDGNYSGPCSNEHTDNYNFSYQTDTTKGKFIHSTLLSAYSMGKSVVVVGDGTCLTGSTEVERVQYVKLGGGLPGGPTNNAPTIDNPPGPQTSTVDVDIANINLTATDLDGDSFTFDDNNTLPSGINIDSSTGVISGRPTAVGSSSVVITVDDGTDSTSAPFNWTVEAAGGGGNGFQQDPGPLGIVSMNAASFTSNTPGSGAIGSPYTWDVNGTSIQASPDTAANVSIDIASRDQSPRVDYNINFTKTGTHYIWLDASRGPNGGSSEEVHIALDQDPNSILPKVTGFWRAWTNRRVGNSNPNISVEVSSTGVHTLNVWMGEDGSIINKIVITTDSTYAPSGSGPAESPQL